MPDSQHIRLIWLWLAILVIVCDQATKIWASTELIYQTPVAVMPFFNLTLKHNTGAAFSFLAHENGWQRWFFSALAIGVSIGLISWMRTLLSEQKGMAIALNLILGGALGNVIDRLYYGYVIDFIDLYYQQWHFPAFNLADSAITIGAFIIMLDALRGKTDERLQ
jgi:signal peptidase II